MAIKSAKYVGDFETTTDPEDVRVWASCLVNIDTLKTDHIGNDLPSMFQFLKNRNSVVYFHNLKFDGEFILSYLLSRGYRYSEEKLPGTFDTLISDDGIFYSITVIFSKENKKYRKVTFYDSLKKLPFKVSVIAKAFELKMSKLSIDYDAPRPVGHVLTEEEKEYIVADCRIVAEALKIQFEKGLQRMTNASDAINGYKGIISKERFEKWFPVLPVDLDLDIRRAYKGGFTYLSPRFRGKRIRGGITLDVNSLYPWAMYNGLLPYGYPKFFEGKPEEDERYPLFIVHFKACFKIKPDHIPCLQLKNNRRYVETEYLTESRDEMGVDEPAEMWLTSVDYQLFLDHYDIWNEEYINGWRFKGARGMFKEYIDYWMHIKETTTGAMRQLAKLMLNSLYGKFATNPKARKKIPYLDEEGIVRYRLDDPELRDPVYTAMGCFITAYAREKTIRSAQSVYDRFVYGDTDSLHLTGTEIPEGLEVHPTKLGAWKHEGTFCDSLYIRAKTYMETMMETGKADLRTYAKELSAGLSVSREGSSMSYRADLKTYAKILCLTSEIIRWNGRVFFMDTKVTCAGMPDNVKEKVTYENFHSGSTFSGKLLPKRFKGGIVLVDTNFTIK